MSRFTSVTLFLSLTAALSAAAFSWVSPPRPYAELKREAEAAFARGGYADARDLYLEADLVALPAGEARWVRLRRADAAWRAAASSANPDSTDLDRARKELEDLERETLRPEEKDTTYAEIEESLGDFHWQRDGGRNWGEAQPRYARALDVWAGSTDLDAARPRYVNLVWSMSRPRWADAWWEYGYYSGNWIGIDVLENVVRIATRPEDTARAHYLLGQTLARGGDPNMRARAVESYEAALALGKESEWYDDALYRLACFICDSGVATLDDDGVWTTQYDFPRALELYRRFVREFRPGESRWYDDCQNRIATITNPQLVVTVANAFLPGSKIRYDVSWRNVPTVELALYAADLTRDVVLGRDRDAASFVHGIDTRKLERVRAWTHDTKDDGRHVPGQAALVLESDLAAGAYVLEATGAGCKARDLVLVSDAAITSQNLAGTTLAWFCKNADGKPIANAPVVLWQREWIDGEWRATRFDGVTKDDGTTTFALPAGKNYGDFFVAAKAGATQAFALSHVSWPGEVNARYRVFATTDRPAYRPGGLVQWKFTAREYDGAVYSNPGPVKVRYVIHDPRGADVKSDTVTLNEFGSAFATLETTESMTLGEYGVHFQALVGGQHDQTIGSATLFRLEEYKLPEFEVGVEPATKDGAPLLYRVGDTVAADVVVNYYFGGAVRDADVEVLVKQRPFIHQFPRPHRYAWYYESGRANQWWRRGGEQIVQQIKLKTDAGGKARVTFATPRDVNQEYEYVIEARVTDGSRREVTGSGTVRVTQKAYAVDVAVPHRLAHPGDTIQAELTAQDANGAPVEATGQVTVTRRTYREVWVHQDGRTALSRIADGFELQSAEYEDEAVTTIAAAIGANGQGSIEFVAAKDGYYRIQWSSRDDRNAQILAEASVFVATSATTELGYRGQELELIVDADTFKTGAQAPFMITTAQSGRWVLLTVIADRILESRVVHVAGTAKLQTLAVGAEHVPNAFITVFGYSNADPQQAQVEIVVPPEERFLDVTLTPSAAEAEPGSDATFAVTAKDATGEPVRAELSIAITDASVTAIQQDYAGDPRAFFYGNKRYPQLSTSTTTFWRIFAKLRRADSAGNAKDDELFDALLDLEAPSMEWGERGGGSRRRQKGNLAAANGPRGAARDEFAQDSKLGFAARAPAPAMALEKKEGEADAGADAAVKVRSDFRETALWAPTVVTGADGTAEVKLTWPDSLTRWNARAIAFDATSRTGDGTATVRTRQPLMVRLQAPRFFVVGDEVTISAIVNNDTDAAVNARPTLTVTGLELIGPAAADAVAVAAHDSARADWRVKVTAPGTAKLAVTARTDAHSDAMEKSYPVYAHGVEVFAATSGKMRGAEVSALLDLPALRKDGSTRFSVQVAPSLAVAMLDALPYLIDYPYGCTEQTMSRFLPAAITAKTLADQGLSRADVLDRVFGGVEPATADKTHEPSAGLAKLDECTSAALKRLYDHQHGDGGFGWWKGDESDRFMSAYVLFGMSLAHEAGLDVDVNAMRRVAEFLDQRLVEEEDNPDMQAWLLHAVATYQSKVEDARRAEFAQQAFANLWSKHTELNAYTRALFALAAVGLGKTDAAKTLVDNLKNGVILDEAPESSLVQRGKERTNAATMKTAHWGEDGVQWRWSAGGVEATAFAIRALLAVDPKHELVEPAVNWLLKNRRGNQWSNTRDTAICVLAMNDYLRVSNELGRSIGYEVYVNGAKVAERTVAPAEILAAPSVYAVDPALLVSGANEVMIRRTSGDGPLYFAAQTTFFSTEARVQPRGNEIFVRRQYWKLVPRPTLLKGVLYDRVPMHDGDAIVSGERVEVVLTIEAKNHYDYLIFEDLKPAGLEAVLQKSGEPLWANELKKSETEARYGDDGEEHESTTAVRDPGGRDDGYGTTGRTAWIHTELRDRKVALFLGHLPQGVWEVKYDLRAEVPGTFAALPVLGHAMYVPEVRCNGEEIAMRVEERP